MKTKEITFTAESVSIEASTGREVSVTVKVTESSMGEILECMEIDTIVSGVGITSILDHIGIDEVKKYFNLTEEE